MPKKKYDIWESSMDEDNYRFNGNSFDTYEEAYQRVEDWMGQQEYEWSSGINLAEDGWPDWTLASNYKICVGNVEVDYFEEMDDE